MSDVLLVDRSEGVATLTLNRPDSMNSLSLELKRELLEQVRRLSADWSVRAVVLTGSGRGFCVGQDLREHLDMLDSDDPVPLRTVAEDYNPLLLALAAMPQPLIAAVNGMAAGAGAGLAFACDLRIAARTAGFLIAFANVGLTVDTGVSWTLQRLVGQAKALEMSLLAEPVSAEAAYEIGLVNRLVEPDELTARAQELAARLAAGPSVAYAAIKKSIAYAATHDLPAALVMEDELQTAVGASEDHRAATSAFVAKQKPTFTGR